MKFFAPAAFQAPGPGTAWRGAACHACRFARSSSPSIQFLPDPAGEFFQSAIGVLGHQGIADPALDPDTAVDVFDVGGFERSCLPGNGTRVDAKALAAGVLVQEQRGGS